ncbi:hypothetical protein LCP963914a_9672 [Penicillium roqueforti]|nr:hypothetical protein LCP963914a_9672 [Penicillium roqueforti]
MEHHVTQRLSISVQNDLPKGNIVIKNTVIACGQPYEKSDIAKLLSPEDVNQIMIPHDENRTISFCGSATYRVGVEGTLDLYHDIDGQIVSLYWNGPWTRTHNQFNMANLNCEEYTVNMSPIQESGILGDVSVIVAQTSR